MNYEINRISTFNGWPATRVDPRILASHGFYYVGYGDLIRCAFCPLEIYCWRHSRKVLNVHNNCPFVRGMICNNVPLVYRSPVENLEITMFKIPNYKLFDDRVATFRRWKKPFSTNLNPYTFSEAGLYYMGWGDKTRCFSCGEVFEKWSDTSIPILVHAYYQQHCIFLNMVRSSSEIQQMVNFPRNSRGSILSSEYATGSSNLFA